MLFVGLFSLTVSAQRHFFIKYSVNEGLAQSQVRDMVQSDDGFIWIATVGGISRFDGNNFLTFNKSNGLINNLTNALHQTSTGEIVASCAGGLVFLKGDEVRQFVFDEPYANTLVNAFISLDNSLVLGTNGRGLLFYESDSITKHVDLGNNDRNFIRCLKSTRSGVLAGTKSGLIKIQPTTGAIETIADSLSINSIVGDLDVQWIATNGEGLFRLKDGELKQYSRKDGLQNMYVRDITIDHLNRVFIISKNAVQRFDPINETFQEIRSFDQEVTSNMKVMLTDQEHNLWIGTDGYGILKFTGEQFEIYSREDGISSNIVMDITQWKDSIFAFATYGSGVTLKSPSSIDTINHSNGLTNLTVWSLLDNGNELWLGTSDGLFIYDGNKLNPFVNNQSLPFPRVSNLFKDSKGNIWIATRDGVLIWANDSLFLPKEIKDLESKDIKGFEEVDGTIWYTSNKGLVGYPLYEKQAETTSFHKETGFPENNLTCITKGVQSDLWIGSEEGLLHFDIKTQQAERHVISERLSSNIINFLINEANRRLWIGTDHGLFSLDLINHSKTGELIFKAYNQHDGIISNECNQNAAYLDSEQNVWFGTNGGLIKYRNSYNTRSKNEVLAVVLSDIQQNFESVIKKVNRTTIDPLENVFKYNESRIAFRYAAVHFTNPDKVNFSHRLLGLDENWSPATNESYITFSNLAPGDYTFEVRARINDGDWSDVRSFHFHIAAPFWMRWWFLLLCVFSLFAISFLIFRQWEQQRQREAALVDMQNKARILGLEQQTLNAHMNRHFIFNALNSIQYYINTQDRKQANQYLTNFASLVRKNLDSAQVESIYLIDELERLKLYISLEQMRFKDRFDVEIVIDNDIDIDMIQVPSMILQPFIENSIMHGILPSEVHGKIKLAIMPHEQGVKFTIEDNGIGYETSIKHKNGTSHHVSNGMKITKQRIDLLAKMMNSVYGVFGPVEIKDERGNTLGSKVDIILPLNYQKFRALYSK